MGQDAGGELPGRLGHIELLAHLVEGVGIPSNRLRWVCMPDPGWSVKGLGMKLA